jgi:hypothetical protein
VTQLEGARDERLGYVDNGAYYGSIINRRKKE